MSELVQIATILRALQIFYHAAHNTITGQAFWGDHLLLGGFYPEAESDYDAVVERFIGLNSFTDFDWIELNNDVAGFLDKNKAAEKTAAKDKFIFGLSLEERLIECCAPINGNKEYSFGTQQLIGDVANHSEARQYKIRQRLA